MSQHELMRRVSTGLLMASLVCLAGCATNVDIIAVGASKYSEAASNLAKAGEAQLAMYRDGRRSAILENQFIVNAADLPHPDLRKDQFLTLVCGPQSATLLRLHQLSLLKEYGETAAKLGGAPDRNIPALVGSIKAKVPEPPNAAPTLGAGTNDVNLKPDLDAAAFAAICQLDVNGLLDPGLLAQMNAMPEAAGGDLSNVLGFVGAAYEVIVDGLQLVERAKRRERLKAYIAKADAAGLGDRAISKVIEELGEPDENARTLCTLNENVKNVWPCRGRSAEDVLTAWDTATLYMRRANVSRAYQLYLGLYESIETPNEESDRTADRVLVVQRIAELVDVLRAVDQQVDPPDLRKTVLLVAQAHDKLKRYIENKVSAAEAVELLAAAAKSTKGVLDHLDALRKAEDVL